MTKKPAVKLTNKKLTKTWPWNEGSIVAKTKLADGTPIKITLQVTADRNMAKRRTDAKTFVSISTHASASDAVETKYGWGASDPRATWKKSVLPTVIDLLPTMARELRVVDEFDRRRKVSLVEINDSALKARWSMRGFCPCGCSPMFMLDGVTANLHRNIVGLDVELG